MGFVWLFRDKNKKNHQKNIKKTVLSNRNKKQMHGTHTRSKPLVGMLCWTSAVTNSKNLAKMVVPLKVVKWSRSPRLSWFNYRDLLNVLGFMDFYRKLWTKLWCFLEFFGQENWHHWYAAAQAAEAVGSLWHLCLSHGRLPNLVMTNSLPWFVHGPNRNRWFTWVYLAIKCWFSMANCSITRWYILVSGIP